MMKKKTQEVKQQQPIAMRRRTEVIEVARRLVVAAALREHRVEAEFISLVVQALQQEAAKDVVTQHNLQDRESKIKREIRDNMNLSALVQVHRDADRQNDAEQSTCCETKNNNYEFPDRLRYVSCNLAYGRRSFSFP